MPAKVEMIGLTFGRLRVVREAPKVGRVLCYECECECGKTTIVRGYNLRSGATRSCGCLMLETASQNGKARTTHGGKGTRLFCTWTAMRARCRDKRNKHYGGKGISVCEDWNTSFPAFREWAYANGYTDELTIDRINPNGNYEPSNCRWISIAAQQKNRTSNIIYKGVCLKDYALSHGLNYGAIKKRIEKGWPVEDAVETPLLRNRQTKEPLR